jgi:hypothetical protein
MSASLRIADHKSDIWEVRKVAYSDLKRYEVMRIDHVTSPSEIEINGR